MVVYNMGRKSTEKYKMVLRHFRWKNLLDKYRNLGRK